jgi:sugar phosphate isomerase/epimerase
LLGLKCSTEDSQFNDRLSQNPDIIEFHLIEEDLFGFNRKNLESKIKIAQDNGIIIYLHHPILFQKVWLNIIDDNSKFSSYYDLSTHILIEICTIYDIYCIIHPHYGLPGEDGYEKIDFRNSDNISKAKERIAYFESISNNRILWENSTVGYFSFENPDFFNDFVLDMKLSICFDISHAFISFKGDNTQLKEAIISTLPYTQYYHVVDSMGLEHDSLDLGTGNVDWTVLIPYIINKPYIFEINLKNLNFCNEMISSFRYLEKLKKIF